MSIELTNIAPPVEPYIAPGHTISTVTDKINNIILTKTISRGWLFSLAIAMAMLMFLGASIAMLLLKGVGIWGINIPVGWGFAIINFVWWIGIGHAGTLISAILLLLRQEWRTSINRFAEAMTIFAVSCAGMFPMLHLGRIWKFYYLFPYPNVMGLYPQWRSPLVWDVFAVSTYATVSTLFWFIGLIPDLATLRDRTENKIGRTIYGILALGWRGSAMHWHRYESAYLMLAALCTPLVVSVHSIVGLDFAVGQVPGWHATIFPPYFVAGAILSGFAMVLSLTIPIRAIYGLKGLITMRHLENMCRVMLACAMIVTYGYFMEGFLAWYSDDKAEWAMVVDRLVGPYHLAYWALLFCNAIVPQMFWFKSLRRNIPLLFLASILVNIGMWLERFIIVVTSLSHAAMPSSFGMYYPTFWDWATYIGTFGLFFFFLFMFIRLLPMISAFEMRELVAKKTGQHTATATPEAL